MDPLALAALSARKNDLPKVTAAYNNKIIQVIDGKWTAVNIESSAVSIYIDNLVNEVLGGKY